MPEAALPIHPATPVIDEVVDLVEQAWAHDVFISFDPNLRTQFLGEREQAWRDVESLADRSGLVKMSNEDVDLLRDLDQPGPHRSAAHL